MKKILILVRQAKLHVGICWDEGGLGWGMVHGLNEA